MKKFIYITTCFIVWLSTALSWAETTSTKEKDLTPIIKRAVQDLVEDNKAFAESKDDEHFQEFQSVQNPRVTMVLCSDSRVHTHQFSKGAVNDVFTVRNIGNQFDTAPGSVMYGVDVLQTPVLIFIGHSHCGAIKAAMGDISTIPNPIQKELKTLDVKKAPNDNEGVILNVHHQVDAALSAFKKKVDAGELAIIGAVYDFRNDYGHGKGQLIIVNLNGEIKPQKIQDSHYFDHLQNVSIGTRRTDLAPI